MNDRQRANFPSILVGVVLVIAAGLGLLYNAMTLNAAWAGAFAQLSSDENLPYFYHALGLMSAFCILCYLTLIVCGIDLVRSRLRWSRLVTLILILEVGYFFAVGSLWLEPTIGHSVAAATGVANGGLMVQFAILLPLWAPLVLWWARSREAARMVEQKVGA
jgi:hypothetical protein